MEASLGVPLNELPDDPGPRAQPAPLLCSSSGSFGQMCWVGLAQVEGVEPVLLLSPVPTITQPVQTTLGQGNKGTQGTAVLLL